MACRLYLACLLGSAAAYLAGTSPSVAASKPPQHLYVSVVAGTADVLRYPIVNGFPAPNPDRRYAGVGAPATVGPDGTLYAEVNDGQGCFGIGPIDVFAPGAISPTRTLTLPPTNGSTTAASSITVSDDGFVYVGFFACLSGRDSRTANILASTVNHGIAVYAPKTSGPSFLVYSLPDQASPIGFALGRGGVLYASTYLSQSTSFVYTIAHPRTKPTVIRTLHIGLYALGIALSDGGQNLYVQAGGPQGVPAQIQVFPYDASGQQPPSRILNLPNYSGPSVAIFGAHLFTEGPNLYTVLGFPKHANGSPPPVFTLHLPGSEPGVDLSFGP